VIVATTNHESLLDRAIFRRFDAILKYELPSEELAIEALKMRLQGFDVTDVQWTSVVAETRGLSQAEIIGAAEDAARDAILERGPVVLNSDLRTAVAARRRRSG
jgi:SpoVK/Ycf46/Vps4 family AAA+-type ATPase